MAGANPYLRALAPGRTSAQAGPQPTNQFGLAVVTGLVAAGRKGAQFLRSERGQQLVAKLGKWAKDEEGRAQEQWLRYRNRAAKATDPTKKAQAQRKADRYAERFELAKVRRIFAARGIGGKEPMALGTILEHRRNVLALEWKEATPESKKKLSALIKGYDTKLAKLKREADVLAQAGFGATESPRGRPFPMSTEKAAVTGIGGLQFDTQSPPGPARLTRLPMYPVNDADAMSGATGLLAAGDDPMLLMQLTQNAAAAGFVLGSEYQLTTRTLQYGTYRVLGIQCSFQENYVPKDPNAAFAVSTAPVLGVGLSVRSLEIYNGAELLLPLNDLAADSFVLLRPQGGSAQCQAPGAYFYHVQAPYGWTYRQGALFMGLRTYPVVDSDSTLQMTVQAYAMPVAPGFVVPVPICVNLVCEILTDKVYGDPISPSPAARAGALVQLSAAPTATSVPGQQMIHIQTSRWRRPT